jgi:hypothetical protein
LSDTQYNWLKHVASVGLPAVAALYYALGQLWHFPNIEQVVATVAIVNTFLGTILGYSTVKYNASEAKYAGIIEIAETEFKKIFSLNLTSHPDELVPGTEATFKIESTGNSPGVTNIPPESTAHGASQ